MPSGSVEVFWRKNKWSDAALHHNFKIAINKAIRLTEESAKLLRDEVEDTLQSQPWGSSMRSDGLYHVFEVSEVGELPYRQTGNLSNSMEVDTTSTFKEGETIASVYTTVPYAATLEVGFPQVQTPLEEREYLDRHVEGVPFNANVSPRPFFEPTLDRVQSDMKAVIERK